MKKNIAYSSLSLFFAGIFFVINDAIINYLSVSNIKFYHFIFYGMPAYMSVPAYLYFSGNFKLKMRATNYYIPLVRGIIFAPIPFLIFLALKNISLPEFTTINMSAPIFAALLSILILKDKLNIYIVISLIFGLGGVILVIQPGFETFNFYFLISLLATFLVTINTIIVNKYNEVTSSAGYFVYGGIFIHLLSIIFFIIDPIKINIYIFFLITIASIFINLAILLTVVAFKFSQKFFASIFCLVYLQILWSCIIGFIIFDEFLNNFALIGAILIILSGIISIPGQFKQINEQ